MDIKLRRGTAAAWTSANPVLDSGEPGYETDTGKMKVGDGSTAWSLLGYFAGSVGSGGQAIGGTELVYRYTVTGADKASIDTGVDTKDAGSGDWTNGDLLEIHLSCRTDDAAAAATVDLTFNNDTGTNYDGNREQVVNTTVTGATFPANASVPLAVHGSGGGASYASAVGVFVPNFGGSTLYKGGWVTNGIPDATAGNLRTVLNHFGYRSTSPITRAAVAAAAGQKFKIGTQLSIYKRLSSGDPSPLDSRLFSFQALR
jgi:Major tropism determinant N-terminal domain